MTPESKPQGSEQPGRPHPSRNFEEDFQHENGNYLNVCSDCGKQFLGYKRRVTCKLCSLPTPSSDEEVETPLVDAAFAEYPVMDTQRGGDAIAIQAARAIEKQLRQQHNAEREDAKILANQLGALAKAVDEAFVSGSDSKAKAIVIDYLKQVRP